MSDQVEDCSVAISFSTIPQPQLKILNEIPYDFRDIDGVKKYKNKLRVKTKSQNFGNHLVIHSSCKME
jgi:hypothetical protein